MFSKIYLGLLVLASITWGMNSKSRPNQDVLCASTLANSPEWEIGQTLKNHLVRESVSGQELGLRPLKVPADIEKDVAQNVRPILELYKSLPWNGSRPHFPSFLAFFLENQDVLSPGDKRFENVRVAATASLFNELRTKYTQTEFHVIEFSKGDPVLDGHFLPYGFLTDLLLPGDRDLVDDSFIRNANGEVVDTREMLKVRLHHNVGEPYPVYAKTGQNASKILLDAFSKLSFMQSRDDASWWGSFMRLTRSCMEYALHQLFTTLKIDDVSTMASQIANGIETLRQQGQEVYFVEIPHTHPLDTILLKYPEDTKRFPELLWEAISDDDIRVLEGVTISLARDHSLSVPIGISAIIGATPQTLSKEYHMLIPVRKTLEQ